MKASTIKIVSKIGVKGYLKFLSDELYLKLIFKNYIGEELNLKDPKTFNEKLQWLKINDRNPRYTKMADKYEVREYIGKNIGDEYLIPLVALYDSVEEIQLENLPGKFVLKSTHDSGGVVICKDKKNFDFSKAKEILQKSLNRNYYDLWREWPYKNIRPRIICEEYMECNEDRTLNDYKFMCFGGKVKVIQYHMDRFNGHRQYHYDRNGCLMEFNNQGYSNEGAPELNMDIINEMIPLAEKLSKNLRHIRVDFYNVNGKIYFGELTFFDASGLEKIEPRSFDNLLGEWIDLGV